MPTLADYNRKRDFSRTKEPPGKVAPRRATLSFTIQKHDASRLHYDFRLELDGVLLSWAVPKGPSLDPADRRLAVRVEDHPVEYGQFEGTIPEGEYGGGTVLLWDTGTWEPIDADPKAALRKGKLSFTLSGRRLKGDFTLARLHGSRAGDDDGKNWLLFKKSDKHAQPGKPPVVDRFDTSVKSDRTIEEIAQDKKSRVWSSKEKAAPHDEDAPARTPRAKARGTSARTTRARQSTASSNGHAKRPGPGSRAAKPAPSKPARNGTHIPDSKATLEIADADSLNAPEAATGSPPAKARGSRASTKDPAANATSNGGAKPDGTTPTLKSLPKLHGARKAPMPRALSPQLCTLVDHVPDGPDWLHEIKFDGYRFIIRKQGKSVRMITRNNKDWTDRFAPIAAAIAALPCKDAILDGEAVILGKEERSSFQKLQNAIKARAFDTLAFFAFDLPYINGHDLTAVPLIDRKAVLHDLLEQSKPSAVLRFSEHVIGGGDDIEQQVCNLELEGAISKRADAPYEQRRSPLWVKTKCDKRQEFIIVGHTPPRGSRIAFGSLLLAAHDDQGRLIYTGHVGTGFDRATLIDIKKKLDALARATPPLDVMPPRSHVAGAQWVTPKLVCEVRFTEWTRDGHLRHPAFEGLREDKEPKDIRIERPAHTEDVEQVAEHEVPDTAPAEAGRFEEPAASRPEGARPWPGASAPGKPGMNSPARRADEDVLQELKPERARKNALSTGATGGLPARAKNLHAPSKSDTPDNSADAASPRILSRMSSLPRGSSTPITTKGRGKSIEVEAIIEGVEISNPGRVIDPATGLTKFDLARYHALVAERMLPYVTNRPLSTVRCPQGLGKKCFFQKHIGEGFPKAVSSVRVKEKEGKPADYIMIDSVAGLITLVQFGVIEFHPWGSTADNLERPDFLVFDLDPGPGVTWDGVKEGAARVRDALEGVNLTSFLKTSGGKGLHVCAPIQPTADWDTAKAFARAVALHLERHDPARYIANMSKDRRKGRIFVDYLRNGRGATSVAPYAVRARPGSGVSMPIPWSALETLGSAAQFTAADILEGRTKLPTPDPWADFYTLKQSIPASPDAPESPKSARRRPTSATSQRASATRKPGRKTGKPTRRSKKPTTR